MNLKLRMEVYRRGERIYTGSFESPIVMGRQADSHEPLYEIHEYGKAAVRRVAIEKFTEKHISREQAELSPTPTGVAIHNRSTSKSLYLSDNLELPAGQQQTFQVPCQFRFGPLLSYGVSIWIETEEILQSRAQEAPVPGTLTFAATNLEEPAQIEDTWSPLMSAATETPLLNRWLMSLMSVLELAANSDLFFERAAQSVVNFGMHSGQVLLLEKDEWKVRARKLYGGVSGNLEWRPSLRVLEEVRQSKKTVWSETPKNDYSQFGLAAVLAAPIRDRHGAVIGALYGDRRGDLKGGGDLHITDTEVKLIELFGYGIALGMERATQERSAAEQRVLFEQFFSQKLANQLAAHPDLLKGRDEEVTVLFCDIRNFSRRAKEMGTEMTVSWIQDVLEVLSQCVLAREGVIVDYTGDELMAMFGAPTEQSDQALRACLAAQDMLDSLPAINQRWSTRLSEPMQVGIGINSGIAQVGNIGSKMKFKYGPLGHTVNLASRVQGANKFFKTSALITQATRDRLPPETPVRRICAVRVVNIAEPVNLYELRPNDDDHGRKLCEQYEQALALFENKDFRKAAGVLGNYIPDHRDDGPSHILLWRTVNWLVKPKRKFSKAWKLPGK